MLLDLFKGVENMQVVDLVELVDVNLAYLRDLAKCLVGAKSEAK